MYRYDCPTCGEIKRLLTVKASKKPQVCKECGSDLTRAAKGASSKIVETLDNGIMARKVERLADAERIFKERSENHHKLREPK